MELENSIGYLLNYSARLNKRSFDHALKEYGVTTSHWAILHILSEEKELTQVQIAKKLHCDKATLGTVLDKLEKKDLIMRVRSNTDRRSYEIQITDKALSMMDAITKEAMMTNALSTKGFTQDEKDTLKRLLKQMIMNLGGDLHDDER